MAWTTPITFTTGNVLTASQLNTNLRDNTNYLFDQPMAELENSIGATIATATDSTINYDATVYSSPGITITANVGKFLPTFSGTYMVWANHVWGGHASGIVEAAINDTSNASIAAAYDIQAAASTRNAVSISGSTAVMNGSTHFVQMRVAQNSGSNQSILAASTGPTIIAAANINFCFGIKMLGTGS